LHSAEHWFAQEYVRECGRYRSIHRWNQRDISARCFSGPTFASVIAKQFWILRVADRFFYDDTSQVVSFDLGFVQISIICLIWNH